MGVPSSLHAAVSPSIASLNCHMTSGFSGLPKFRQLVAAMGRAPEEATLRAASATACIAPTRGFSWHQRPLPSVERAKARLVPLMRTTAASDAPGVASVFVRTMVSYCSVIQRLEAMVGDARSFTKFSTRLAGAEEKENQSAALSFFSGGWEIGRRYTGPSSARGWAGISATSLPWS